jgi:hypothetical protein
LVNVTVASSTVPEVIVIDKVKVTESPAETVDADLAKLMLQVGVSETVIDVEAVTSVADVEPELADIVKGVFFVPVVSALKVNMAEPPLCDTIFWQSELDGHDNHIPVVGVSVAVISLLKPLACIGTVTVKVESFITLVS